MVQTTVQICGVNGERKIYGFTASGEGAIGRSDTFTRDTHPIKHMVWCRVHDESHPSTEVVVDVPFEGNDFNDVQGQFDPEWGERFDALALQRADQILFEATPTNQATDAIA